MKITKKLVLDSKAKELPQALKDLVHWSTTVFGEVIQEQWGQQSFLSIETIRKRMASLRGKSNEEVYLALEGELRRFSKFSQKDLSQISRSYSIMLELINCCEAAYRDFRISTRTSNDLSLKSEKSKCGVRLVLTSHPTEARSSESVFLFQGVQRFLWGSLGSKTPDVYQKQHLKTLFAMLLEVSLFKNRKPQVVDEAKYLASIVLREEILDLILTDIFNDFNFALRTWVGGDKDGHPGVDKGVMLKSFQIFRSYLLVYLKRQLLLLQGDLRLVKNLVLVKKAQELEKFLLKLRVVKNKDSRLVEKFWAHFSDFEKSCHSEFSGKFIEIQKISNMRLIFPALVVPLELRESSELIEEIVCSKVSQKYALSGMLQTLKLLSEEKNILNYAQALVVSQVRSSKDILNALALVKVIVGSTVLPVVPLFEDENALKGSKKILSELIAEKNFSKPLRRNWGSRLEIMLGYSDSAKESGVLFSRLLVQKTMFECEELCHKNKIKIIFFNGSGGSVARGGGNFEEQSAWWSPAAFDPYKATVQGEMVQRTFASSHIFSSYMNKIPSLKFTKSRRLKTPEDSVLWDFADGVKKNYHAMVRDSEFLNLIQVATVYPFLSLLKLGSRPSKRTKLGGVSSLRAIPWILTWTQARLLLPNWWGVGSAWLTFAESEKRQLQNLFESNPLFSSFIKQLGFTLAKVELPVWKLQLEQFSRKDQKNWTYLSFEDEYMRTLEFFRSITGQKDFLWFRPWLGESVSLRSPMIFPLNLVQILSMQRKDVNLLRESVSGIACGMMTTG